MDFITIWKNFKMYHKEIYSEKFYAQYIFRINIRKVEHEIIIKNTKLQIVNLEKAFDKCNRTADFTESLRKLKLQLL